jgi:purine catabolism regulator
MIAAATRLGFPLFEVPYEVPFIAVTEKAFTHLVNEHYAVLQRALSAHERLERIVLSERGLDGVAGALASLIGGPAIDLRRPRRGARPPRAATPLPRRVAALAEELRERARAGAAAATRPAASCAAARWRCPSPRTPQGKAAATARRRRPGSSPPRTAAADRVRPAHAAPGGHVVALELLRRRVADDTERRLAGDVLTAMVSGELDGAELAPPAASRSAARPRRVRRAQPPRPRRRRRGRARPRAARRGPAGLAAGTGRFSCALLAAARRRRRRAVRARRAPAARGSRGGRRAARAGAGPRGPAGELRRAFHEARCALEARALAPTARRAAALATYRDLGSFQLLLSLQDDEALRLFCDSILARSRRARAPTAAS